MFVLNFHGIDTPKRELPAGERGVWMERAPFEAILDYVQTRSDVELTFDDANESDFTVAMPALCARGLKARFFLVANRIGQAAFLSRSQVEGLLASGMALGNHGMRHRSWALLSKRELDEELVEARDRLEQLAGIKIDQASCPFGSYNRRVIRSLRRTGYKSIYTSDGGPAEPDSLLIPRNSVQCTWNLEALQALLGDEMKGARRIWRKMKLLLKRWR